MIIKSHIRGGFRAAASYLKAQGENEKVRLVAMSGPHVSTLDQAFSAMWAIAEASKVKKPLHHVSINPHKDERLTDLQVEHICSRLEARYGYRAGEHQRVIVEHIKEGRQHFHVMWNRVNRTTGKSHYPYMHWTQSRVVAREIEQTFGLRSPFDHKERQLKARGWLDGKTLPSRQWQPMPVRPPQPVRPSLYDFGGANIKHTDQPAMNQHGDADAAKSQEQYNDYQAVMAGRMSWAQYFQKWGGGGLLNELGL